MFNCEGYNYNEQNSRMMDGAELHQVHVSAPGKIILHGEHAVVYGKTAIAVSLNLRTTMDIKEVHSFGEPSINVRLPSVDLNETIELKPIVEKLFNPPYLSSTTTEFKWMEPAKLDHEKHLKNVECHLRETRPNFGSLKSNQQNSLRCLLYTFSGIFGSTNLPVSSMNMLVKSQLSVGAGTGSSASFAVCLAGATIQLINMKIGLHKLDFSPEDKNIISAWAYNCERITHGSPSGIDNLTCTLGSLISFRKGEGGFAVPLRRDLRVLLVDTRVARETSTLTGKVAELRRWNGAAVDSIMDACDHVTRTATRILCNLSSNDHDTDLQDQYKRLEELWDMNHCLLGALGVSHPSLEAIRRAARAHGFASKLTGAGGGGYAIVLIPPSSPQVSIDNLTRELVSLGYRATDTQLAGSGVCTILSVPTPN